MNQRWDWTCIAGLAVALGFCVGVWAMVILLIARHA